MDIGFLVVNLVGERQQGMIQIIWLFFFEGILSLKGKADYLEYYLFRFLFEISVELIIILFILGKFIN